MYTELHCHSNYSFQEGASSVEELLTRAVDLGYPALALTDHDNLCGAMEFSRIANAIGIQPITGAEITLEDGSHLTLLSRTRKGYSNLCNLITHSRFHKNSTDPRIDTNFLKNHTEGLTLLTGCARGKIPTLVTERRDKAAEKEITKYLEWFGTNNVFVELQQNMVYGDTSRNKLLVQLAKKYRLNCVATNNVHYHIPERHRLQDSLVAIRHNLTLEESHIERRANNNFYLKPAAQIADLFSELPDAIANTIKIAEQCTFNLKEDLGYELPNYPVPPNYTPLSYLKEICYQAAVRKYGSINTRVRTRLEEEFHLLQLHNLSGFFLIYYEIIQLARQAMIDLGVGSPEIPLEERPPGRGRGSSVASLVAYLIGLSHIDPLAYNLSLNRFLNNDMSSLPDIDLDFPRNIRAELIQRIHDKYGWNHAAITGSIATYKMKGCIKDIGKVLGIPSRELYNLSQQIDDRHSKCIESEMTRLPSFREKMNHPY
jgi:error-prone DNA polymerase